MNSFDIQIENMKKQLLEFSNDMKKLKEIDNKSKKHLSTLNK